MARDPVVAGQFYPADKSTLSKDIGSMVPLDCKKINAIGAVSPHAGYEYSGRIAGEVYARIRPKATYVILNPNHHGYGARFAASSEPWKTPLGATDIDDELLALIMKKTRLVESDRSAHAFEHSGEVQVPFIQTTSPGARIVPITVMHGSVDELLEVSRAIADAITETRRDAVIIASTDMTHYESRKAAGKKDKEAIAQVLKLDPLGLLKVVEEKNISMCGYIPTAMMLMGALKLGATKAELVKYADSGAVTGDTDQVVGYAGILVY